MITKYIVFGQSHKHPDTGQKLKSFMIKVQAPNEAVLNVFVAQRFGPYYSRLIDTPDYVHYPGGILETFIINVHSFKGETSFELVDITLTAQKINQDKEEQADADKRRSGSETSRNPRPAGETASNKREAPGETKPSEKDGGDLDYLS